MKSKLAQVKKMQIQIYHIKKDIGICFLAVLKTAIYLRSTRGVILATNNNQLQKLFRLILN